MKVLTFWVGWLAVGAGDVVVTGLLGMMAGVLFVVLAVRLAGRGLPSESSWRRSESWPRS
jgi:hypothetical protein